MDEQRQQDYLNLIQALLDCPSGEENDILNAHENLIDEGLVGVMEQVAAQLAQQGDGNRAEFLTDVARRLAADISNSATAALREEYLAFLLEVLLATGDSNANREVVYPLLSANRDKLNDTFAELFARSGAEIMSQVEPEQAPDFAKYFFYFSNLIAQFTLGNRASNLEIAIAGYHLVMRVFTRDADPQKWATTQNNLGTAYSNRIKGDIAENLEQAIEYYRQALLVRTRDADHQYWAMTQNNLGNAYRNRIKGDKAENLELAIECHRQALLVSTRDAFPQQWAMTQTNLGTAYSNRIKGDKAENLELAIECHRQALLVSTRDAFPQQWAMTQKGLGLAYQERIKGDKAENLERAIECYRQALLVRTRDAFPQDWAMTQNNLGNAYKERGQIEEAIQCYQSALEIRTPATFPLECLQTGRNLGNMAFTAGRWREAMQGYAPAIDAVEESRSQAMSDERRQEIVSQSIGIYQNMVQACIKTGNLEKAFEYVERSRS